MNIALLLIPPSANEVNEKVLDEILQHWTRIFQRYPSDGQKLCLLFLPWFHKLNRDRMDHFQCFLNFSRI